MQEHAARQLRRHGRAGHRPHRGLARPAPPRGQAQHRGRLDPGPRPRSGRLRERRGPLTVPSGPGAPESVAALTDQLRAGGYLADRGLSTALYVALSLHRPLLLEGEVGVGKTEVAKVLAAVSGRRLIRLQCYEGIDTNQALYEWDYARQMLQIRALSERDMGDEDAVDRLFGPKFLVERPLLDAVRAGDSAVLLVDEVDRADDEFEAFLLELLSDFQVTIPEIGTIVAQTPPAVVLTSNRTREL